MSQPAIYLMLILGIPFAIFALIFTGYLVVELALKSVGWVMGKIFGP